MTANVCTIVFSKDRPLQLDLTLQSLFLHCQDIQRTDIKIIYRTSNGKFQKSYLDLVEDYMAQIQFIYELDFKKDLLDAMIGYDYVLFVVDDCIFVRPFSFKKMINAIEKIDKLIGFSLRLGENTTHCYPMGQAQSLPMFNKFKDNILYYMWYYAELDFAYPLEISSSMYKIDTIKDILNQCAYGNPNQLEASMEANLQYFIPDRGFLGCYKQSAAFCAPMNRVQDSFPNKFSSARCYSAEKLLDIYNEGHRINHFSFDDFVPKGCHEEVAFDYT